MSRREVPVPLVLALAATLASAHGLDALEGTAVVRPDRVEVTIEVDGAAQDVIAQLALHDESGRSLVGRVESVEPSAIPGHLVFRVGYPLARPARWLSRDQGSTPQTRIGTQSGCSRR